MHLRILLLLAVVSIISLATVYGVKTIKNTEFVQGTQTTDLDTTTLEVTAANSTIYECVAHDYLGKTCDTSKPIGNGWKYLSERDRSGCGLVSGGTMSTRTTCKVITESSCNAPGSCQVGGIGCCDGQTPVSTSGTWCSSQKVCPAITGQNLNCGSLCASNSNCASGLTCMDLKGEKRCWDSKACPTDPVPLVNVQGKVLNCYGQAQSNVAVTMFSHTSRDVINTTTTDVLGNYRITKRYTQGVPMFSLMAGKDAGINGTNYYTRALMAPIFTSPSNVKYNCGVVNCSYKQAQVAGGPSRNNYHVGWQWTESQFKARIVHSSVSAKGFNFKQTNCSLPLVVRAMGTPAANVYPLVAVVVDGYELKRFNVTGTYSDYQVNINSWPEVIELRYLNDTTSGGQDRNLRVDNIKLGTTIYQTEDSNVLSKGSWNSTTKCSQGYKKSEWLHCPGFFRFPINSAFSAISKQ